MIPMNKEQIYSELNHLIHEMQDEDKYPDFMFEFPVVVVVLENDGTAVKIKLYGDDSNPYRE